MSLYKAENMKLKEKISQLEERLVGIIGAIKIFSSGMEGREHEMNNQIANLLLSSSELKIVAPYITKEYAIVLQDRAKNGVKIQIVLNDRRLWPTEHENIYDLLKNTRGIDLVNNPNVKYLLVWTSKSAVFTSGPLDKQHLMKTVLIGTLVNQERKLHDLHEIFKEMLPSFMR